MSRAVLTLDSLTDPQRSQFKALTSAPQYAWPTIGLSVVLTITYLSMYWFCGRGELPLWVGTLVNSVVGYVSFSVAHDAIHRAVSKNKTLNDAVGQLGIMLVLPYVDIRLFRWAHILHHRFASGERDPDRAFNGAWYTLPLRWMCIDVVYFVHALKNADKVSRPFFINALRMFAVVAAIVVALIWAGYGLEMLMLWFLPSRLILLALGFSFFWLPHVPHDVSQEENFTRATTVREGYEWLMNPVLQYQNYHLIHHLYPTTPFYNNQKVFQLIEPELRQKDLAVQHGFAIKPTIYPGRA